jgi:hypothetical protein
VGNREQVKHAVRRAAGCGDTGHSVQECAPVEETACRHALFDEVHGERAGAGSGLAFQLLLVRRHERISDARDSEAVDRDGHRVRGEVPCTRACAWASQALELVEVLARHEPAFLGRHRLPHVLDRHLAFAPAAGAHRTVVDEHRGLVHARERHQRGRHRLVATDNTHEAVEIMRMNHQLDRVGNHLARDQRRPHTGGSLRLVVGNRDRVEAKRKPARGGHALADTVGELALVEVARHCSRPRRRDADDRSAEPRRVDAHRPEVRARRRTLGALEQPGAGPSAEGVDRRFSHAVDCTARGTNARCGDP